MVHILYLVHMRFFYCPLAPLTLCPANKVFAEFTLVEVRIAVEPFDLHKKIIMVASD